MSVLSNLRIPLKFKIIGAMVFANIVLIATVSFVYITDQSNKILELETNYRYEIVKDGDFISYLLTSSLIANDQIFMNDLITHFMKKHFSLMSISVTDKDGVIIADSQDDNWGKLYAHPSNSTVKIIGDATVSQFSVEGNKVVEILNPVKSGGRLLGGVITRFNMCYLEEEILRTKHIILYFILIAIGVMVMGAVIAAIIANRIVMPILYMQKNAEKVGKGDLDVKMGLNRNDEIGLLADSFDRMVNDLKISREYLVDKQYVDSIIANMSDALIVLDKGGRIEMVNRAVLDMFGYEEHELTGKSVDMICSGGGAVFSETILPALMDKGYVRNVEFDSKAKDARQIYLLFSGSVMRENENVKNIICLLKDITERKKAEDDIKRNQAQLMQASKMTAIGQLAGGVAHEINNPIGVILGFAQSVVKRIDNDDPLAMPLKSIEREAIRCKKMIVDLLTFSRTAKPAMDATDINALLDDTLSLIEPQAHIKNISVKKDYALTLPHPMANNNQIQQVIVNLCNNAIDAMPDGGRIIISTSHKKGAVEISVTDTGVGISQDIISKIFEPFFTTKEIGKGTGLGLSLCYEIIQKHNGAIKVESSPGSGTTFTISIPVNIKGENI